MNKQADFLKKNQSLSVAIEDVNAEGLGVGKTDGSVVFVADGLPGDILKVRLEKVHKSYAYGKIIQIVKASPYRLDHDGVCPVADRCGGCQWQHCDYAGQLLFKQKRVYDAFKRISHIPNPPVLDIIGMDNPYHYRNKAQFPIKTRPDGKSAEAGFFAPRSHRLVPVSHCNIQHPIHEAVLQTVLSVMTQYNIPAYDEASHTGLIRHVLIKTSLHTQEAMVILVINDKNLPHSREWVTAFKAIAGVTTLLYNSNTAKTNVITGDYFKILFGSGYIHERIGDIEYRLSARSFFQVNPVQTKILYDTALAFGGFTGSETVIDAHTGIGGIALHIAKHVKNVIGVEIVPEAIADATYNAKHNNIHNAEFITGAAEQVIPSLLKRKIDTIMLDPPRKGCDPALLSALQEAPIPKIVYVSCDPATLARDVQLLAAGGYQLVKAQPVDMFPMTAHVECVALIARV